MPESRAIEELLEHAALARRLARALVGDAARADDVVQQTWLSALEHPPHGGRGLKAWLATVVRNSAAKLRRDEARREAREQQAATPEPLPSTDEVVAQIAAQRALLDAVARLEEPGRSTIHARFFEERTPTQIAAAQGIPVRTVETRLRRAIERLRADLDARVPGGRSAWVGLLVGGTAVTIKTKSASAIGISALVVATAATVVLTVAHVARRDEAPIAAPDPAVAQATPDSKGAGAPAAAIADAKTTTSAARETLATSVTVLSPDGVGMAGAAVVLFRGDDVLGQATTDQNGSASVPMQTEPCCLLVYPRTAPTKMVEVAAKAESIEVNFDEGPLFTGHVRVEGHVPSAPLDLKLTADPSTLLPVDMPLGVSLRLTSLRTLKNLELSARTGPDGEFAFYGLAPHHPFGVHFPVPYEDAKSGDSAISFEEARENVELDLRFNASVHGRLVDRSGAPLQGWHVEGWASLNAGLGRQPKVESDADGVFRFFLHEQGAKPISATHLHVREPGGAFVRSVAIEGGGGRDYDVGDVAIDTRRVVSLDPRDEGGRSIDRFAALIERKDDTDEGIGGNPWHLAEAFDVVDAVHARAGLLLPDRVKSLRVVAPGFQSVDVSPVAAAAPVTIRLPAAASLDLDVRDALGPMPPMTILELSAAKWPAAWSRDEVIAAHAALGGSPMPWDLSSREKADAPLRLAPAKDGTYRAVALLPGLPITLVVRENFGTELLREEVVLAPGENLKLERRLARDPVTIEGFVHDPDGKPLPRTRIELRSGRGVDLAFTKEDGRFKVDGLQAPRVDFVFKAEKHAWKWLRDLDVRAVEGPLDVELKPGCSMECEFFSAGGVAVPAEVWVEPSAARPHPDGSDLPPEGPDRIDAESDGAGIFAFPTVPDRSLLRARIGGFTFAWPMTGGNSVSVNATLHGPVEIDWSVAPAAAAGRTLTALRLLPPAIFRDARATIPIDAAAAARGSGLARIEKVPASRYSLALVWSDVSGSLTEETTDVVVDVSKSESARVTLTR